MNNKNYILIGLIFCLSGLVLILLSKKDFSNSNINVVDNTQDSLEIDAFSQPETVIDSIVILDSIIINKEESPLVLNQTIEEHEINPENKYLVVVGSFKINENANKLVEELIVKGFKASFVYKANNNFSYAVIDSYSSRKAAKKSLISSELDGWVKKK